MTETVAYKYRAFISYSHADTSWAKWLHRGLEGFRSAGRAVVMAEMDFGGERDRDWMTRFRGS